MKRIIVEGMDSTGKSTLIEQLKSEFHFLAVITNQLGPEQDFDSWWPFILTSEQGPSRIPIHDRFFYSELVYGYHLRGYVKASQYTQTYVAQFLRAEAFLIYARPSDEAIRATLENKPQMEGVIARHERLLEAYDDLMLSEQQYYGDRFLYYDWEDPSAKARIIQAVEGYLF